MRRTIITPKLVTSHIVRDKVKLINVCAMDDQYQIMLTFKEKAVLNPNAIEYKDIPAPIVFYWDDYPGPPSGFQDDVARPLFASLAKWLRHEGQWVLDHKYWLLHWENLGRRNGAVFIPTEVIQDVDWERVSPVQSNTKTRR